MPSQQEVQWSQLKVGVIVLVAVVVLTTLLFLMTSASGFSFGSRKLTITTYFENSAGVKSGAAVNLDGVTIGDVKAVTISSEPARKLTPVKVVMRIDSKFQQELHKDSTAALTTVGVLGDTVIDIDSKIATGPPLQDGDELKTLEMDNLQDIVKAGKGTVESLNVILAKLNTVADDLQSGKGTIGQLIVNPGLYKKVDATADEVHALTVTLNSKRGTVGKLLNDPEMYDRANDAISRIDDITKNLQSGKGPVGRLLTDETMAKQLSQSIANLNSILADAEAGKGSIGILLRDPTFAKNLNDTLTQVDSIVTGIHEGKGTLGKFATDDQAYTNINKLLTESTTLVSTIRSDPKKYLTIHLRIF